MMDKNNATSRNILHNRKFHIVVVAVIAVIIVAIIVFVPQETTSIQLNTTYLVGEKMVYDCTLTSEYNSTDPAVAEKYPSSAPLDFTEIVEVIDFDGQYYTLNFTTIAGSISMSWLGKVCKTGFSNHLVPLNSPLEDILNGGVSNVSYISQLMDKSEVKVGDTFTVPYPGTEYTTGDLRLTFGGYEDLRTSAGTFRVFKVEISTENVISQMGNIEAGLLMTKTIDENYTLYIESGTTRLIKSTIDKTTSTQTIMSAIDNENTMVQRAIKDMVLEQLIKP